MIDQKKIEAQVFDEMVDILTGVGQRAKAFAKGQTPVRTGFAKRSIFFVVLDEKGNVIAGDTQDENGFPIPSYIPQHANGRLRVFLGANAPYFIWLEIGARGRAGLAIIARSNEIMEHQLRQDLASAGFILG